MAWIHELATPVSRTATVTPEPSNPCAPRRSAPTSARARSEEHTSELQSRLHLVCRLLLGIKLLGEVLLSRFAVLAQFVDFLLEGVARRLCGQERLAGSLDQVVDAALALGYFLHSNVSLLE